MEKLDMINDLYNSHFIKEIENSIKISGVNGNKQVEISFPAESSQLFLIENFVWYVMDECSVSSRFWGKINRGFVESITHAIFKINEKGTKEKIKVTATKLGRQFNVIVICGKKSSSPKLCKWNPVLPTDDKDLKGASLYLMNLADNVDFFDDGTEVHLTFNIVPSPNTVGDANSYTMMWV